MTYVVFHDYPGLEFGLPKSHDFPWLSRPSGHPELRYTVLIGAYWLVTHVRLGLYKSIREVRFGSDSSKQIWTGFWTRSISCEFDSEWI